MLYEVCGSVQCVNEIITVELQQCLNLVLDAFIEVFFPALTACSVLLL